MSSVPEQRTFTCNLCDAICGLHVSVQDNAIISIRGNPKDVLSHGHICPKGPAIKELHEDPDRLRQPMRRTTSGWEPIGWEEALDEAAAGLRAVSKAHGRDAVALYVGNPTAHSHRMSFGSQVLAFGLRNTRNFFNPNSQDSNPRLFACMQVYGDGLSMPVPDVDRTDLLLILGANPAASNGSMLALGDVRARLQGIRKRGGRIIVVDPRRTETAAWADEHLFIRPGGDAALLLGMLHTLFEEALVQPGALDRIASGREELQEIARAFPPERVGPSIGIAPERIRALARELAGTPRAAVYGRIGTSQNEFGPVANWLTEVMNAVTGHIDVEGGAMFPVAAADIGPLARLLIGNNYGRWKSRVRGLPEFLNALPSAVLAEEMETPGEGQIRALVCFAGNPALTVPNGDRLARALPKLEYMVAVDYYINETSRHANIILPPTHIFESGNYELFMLQFGVRNLVKYSPPILTPAPGALDDWDICCELAMRLRLPRLAWLRRGLRRLLKKLPEAAIDLLLRLGPYPLTLKQLRAAPDGIDLGPLASAWKRKVHTPDGRLRLAPAPLVADIPRVDRWVSARPSGGLVLIGRRHLRSNNSWMHNLHSLVKGPDRSQLMMHPEDAARLQLTGDTTVRITSRTGAVDAQLLVSTDVMPGVVSLPHGFGHQAAADTLRVAGSLRGPSANSLTDDQFVEPIVGSSILNGVPVSVTTLRDAIH